VEDQAQLDLRLVEDGAIDSLLIGTMQLEGAGTVNMTLVGQMKNNELTTFDFSQADVSFFTGQLNFIAEEDNTAIASVTGTAYGEMLDMRALSSVLSLNAGAGDDVLLGSQGQDWLTGGEGADVFRLTLGHSGSTTSTADVITDLTSGDRLDLTGLTIDGVFAASAKAEAIFGSATDVGLTGLDDLKFDVWVATVDSKDYLVYETEADGSSTELIEIGATASGTLANWQFSAGLITIV
jgi:Ca2+-binding RTX toxin-like protein